MALLHAFFVVDVCVYVKKKKQKQSVADLQCCIPNIQQTDSVMNIHIYVHMYIHFFTLFSII